MQYRNPVILSDYSDPDVIRVGEDFYMVASSFNHLPGVPVLHSKNLVEWEIVGHVFKKLPFDKYDKVRHGEGAWAPSLRYHGGRFYCLIPFPDEGIYVADTDDPRGEWSPLRPLLKGSGYEDPCPVWLDGKCYVAFAFVRSRIGFNSKLALFETDEGLTRQADDFKIIYAQPDIAPLIEGPKFNLHGGYVYILAPVGGVGTGWQAALRSKSVYGPYETKIVMVQGDSRTNGPHQGALVDLDDGGERWAFVHFQRVGPYGRVVHLQPACWENGWPICGKPTYDNLAGNPVEGGEYPVQIKTGARIDPCDDFCGGALSPVWQTPANPQDGWYRFEDGLKLNCVYCGEQSLADVPQLIMQKVQYAKFTVQTRCVTHFESDGDEAGFTVFGREYRYVCAVRRSGKNYLEMREGAINGGDDRAIFCELLEGDEVVFSMEGHYEEYHRLRCTIFASGREFCFDAAPAVWTGSKLGIYARSSAKGGGYATFKYFNVKDADLE